MEGPGRPDRLLRHHRHPLGRVYATSWSSPPWWNTRSPWPPPRVKSPSATPRRARWPSAPGPNSTWNAKTRWPPGRRATAKDSPEGDLGGSGRPGSITRRRSTARTFGIAMFDHPSNLRHPTTWHARDYGLVAANPFGLHDFSKKNPKGAGNHVIPAGGTQTWKYGLCSTKAPSPPSRSACSRQTDGREARQVGTAARPQPAGHAGKPSRRRPARRRQPRRKDQQSGSGRARSEARPTSGPPAGASSGRACGKITRAPTRPHLLKRPSTRAQGIGIPQTPTSHRFLAHHKTVERAPRTTRSPQRVRRTRRTFTR